MPYDAFAAGLGDHRIVTTLCPGGKERMRRLLTLVQSGRFDPIPLITHSFSLLKAALTNPGQMGRHQIVLEFMYMAADGHTNTYLPLLVNALTHENARVRRVATNSVMRFTPGWLTNTPGK